MSIWYNKNVSIADFAHGGQHTMGQHLGIQFTEIGADFIKASMPVDDRTRQPYGMLHGGASVALAETLGSVASALILNPEVSICVGLEINANHIRSVRSGQVIAKATPIHLGATTHVWNIEIQDESDRLVCISRLTVAILKKQ